MRLSKWTRHLAVAVMLVAALSACLTRAVEVQGPFTITQQNVMRGSGGGVAAIQKVARRSDGARVTWKHESQGIPERTIVLPTAKEVRVFEPLGIKTTMRLRSASAGQMSPRHDCMRGEQGERQLDTVLLGHETVYGVETAKLVTAYPSVRFTAWMALPFGCVVLKQTYEEKDASGKWQEVSVLETTDIERGEPVPELFDTSTAVETDPATAAEKWIRARNPNAPDIEKLAQKARAKVEKKQQLYLNYNGKP